MTKITLILAIIAGALGGYIVANKQTQEFRTVVTNTVLVPTNAVFDSIQLTNEVLMAVKDIPPPKNTWPVVYVHESATGENIFEEQWNQMRGKVFMLNPSEISYWSCTIHLDNGQRWVLFKDDYDRLR